MGTDTLTTPHGLLPRIVPLVRHIPGRIRFDWQRLNPATVSRATDLPRYLVLGPIDEDAFKRDSDGWEATWRTTDDSDGWLRIGFDSSTGLYRLQQSWRGIDGGLSQFPARMQLDQILAQGLYLRFPQSWDSSMKALLEARYQLGYNPQPADSHAFFGVPDGAFRTIAFIATAKDLRPIRKWIRDAIASHQPAFPVSAHAHLVVQVVNYVEGRAHGWTADAPRCYYQSLLDTGLAALAMPVREQASDGTAAWTIRRLTYAIFINVPFVGLTEFLHSIEAVDGFVRPIGGAPLRSEFRPVIFPQGLDVQAPSISTWDTERSALSTLVFPGADALQQVAAAWASGTDAAIEQALTTVEHTSAATTRHIEGLLGI